MLYQRKKKRRISREQHKRSSGRLRKKFAMDEETEFKAMAHRN